MNNEWPRIVQDDFDRKAIEGEPVKVVEDERMGDKIYIGPSELGAVSRGGRRQRRAMERFVRTRTRKARRKMQD